VKPEVTARSEARPRRWPPAVTVLIGAGFALWGLSIGIDRLSDNSFFTHLATGRLILDHSIPHSDPYSFTAHGEPWVVQSWLASVVIGWVDSWFGASGIRVLMGLLTAGLAAMAWRLTRPAHTEEPTPSTIPTMRMRPMRVWAPRPLLFGLLLLTITLLAAERGLDPRWLVPVFWLWVNFHGSFPLGLVALGCLWLGRRADGDAGTTEWRCMQWAVVGTVLGAVNPLGPVLLYFPIRLLGRMGVLREVIEWQSPSFAFAWTRLFLVQVVIGVVVLVRRPSYRAAIPLVVFTAAALLGVRNVAVASLVLIPGMARGLADLGTIRGAARSRAVGVAVVAMLVVAMVMARSALTAPAYNLESFPVDAVAWIHENGLHRPGLDQASSDTTGNYLELVYGDQAGAFIDDRVDMYPKQVVDDLLVLMHGAPGWREVLDRNGVDLVLWGRSQPLTGLMEESSDWRILYQDPSWSVACRRGADLGGAGDLATC
jgi:hypothetical protein